MNGIAPRAEIRRCLAALFDDAQLTAFVSDHFPEVSSRFADAMNVDVKHTMLLDAIERNKTKGYTRLLKSARKERELDASYGRESPAELETLISLTERYLSGEKTARPPASLNAEIWRRRSRPPTTGLFGEMPADELIDQLVNPESSAWTDSAIFRDSAGDFLERMERFIEQELRKSSDSQFVELSMTLARASSEPSPLLRQSLSLALITEGATVRPDIESRSQLHKTILDQRQIVLLAPPGSGKTTVLQHYTLFLIRQFRLGASRLIPVYIPLTRYGIELTTGRVPEIRSFLQEQLSELCGSNSHFLVERFHDIAEKGLFLFVLDGLDQMPNRRSETARLERLRHVEKRLRWLDGMVKLAGQFRRREAVTMLLEKQQSISSQLAPQIDPRERQIERLARLWPCATITSCRIHDFIGAPAWQRVEVLPMSETQIDKFVTAYAPEALEVIRDQFASTEATRSLVSNPFYLRMLTRAVEEQRWTHGRVPEEFQQMLGRRGLLLSDLIWRAVHRETRDEKAADRVMARMGELAHFMLDRNVIGALPEGALRDLLGEDFEKTLEIAREAGVVDTRLGPPLSMEFNHQLFMEVLLAYHLRHVSQQKGGFEKSLELLALQGDRWAETIKLLFEMIPDQAQSSRLLDKCVAALENPATWDIATRVLSDVGRSVSARVAVLLEHRHELTRRGAANVLGRIGAIEHTDRLADLAHDSQWPVRRAAVEALVQLGRVDRLEAFDRDSKPIIVRLVFRARILHSADPLALILKMLEHENAMRREQAARAARDVFPRLLKTQSPEALLKILTSLIGNANAQVSIIGYLAAADAPFYIRRRLKPELLSGALENNDKAVNYLARGAVSDVLDKADLEELRSISEKVDIFSGSAMWQDSRETRAYWLLTEAEEKTSPKGFFDSLLAAAPNEVVALTQRLSKRGDSIALGILTYLLGKTRARSAAMAALVTIGENGVGHLLAALRDPLPQVRLAVAESLQFCQLPGIYRREVREVLSQNRIRTYGVSIFGMNDPTSSFAQSTAGGQVVAPVGFVLEGTAVYLASLIFRLGVPWIYWIRLVCMQNGLALPGGVPVYRDDFVVREVERLAFEAGAAEPNSEFWFARGRLLRAVGDLDAARQSLERSLDIDPASERARFELALIHRSQNEREVARSVLELADDHGITPGSDNDVLRRILCLEIERPQEAAQERLELLVQLKLWKDAFPLLISIFQGPGPLPTNAHLWLYQYYWGMGKTAQALAAALKHNKDNPTASIPQIDIDNLRWLHRLDGIPAEVQGEFCTLVELDRSDAAAEFLQQQGILPADGELTDENIDKIHDLSADTRTVLVSILDQTDQARAGAVRRILKLD
jgi:tetratricopeptide (TPR) repeat protein/HEAT repeat protein